MLKSYAKNGQLVIQKGKNADIVGDFGATNRNKYATMHICFYFTSYLKAVVSDGHIT